MGKYGAFQSNHILGRPFHLTFEILERTEDGRSNLRLVPAAELYSHITEEDGDGEVDGETGEQAKDGKDGVEYEVVAADGKVIMRTNQNIIDDPTRQKLTAADIELLKKQEKGSGKELIAKILESHSALDQKTGFALAKYTLRKTKKYLRRFTILPLDVSLLANWMLHEKDSMKIMEMREEMLALIMSWSNVHRCSDMTSGVDGEVMSNGKWLAVDDTGGLLVAAMAERIGILYPTEDDAHQEPAPGTENGEGMKDEATSPSLSPKTTRPRPPRRQEPPPATSNTITLLHTNAQPNLSLLTYFSYDFAHPSPTHPLNNHLRTISYLQLLSPQDDTAYTEPPYIEDSVLATMKSGKRTTYHRKRRRWAKTKAIVDSTRAGEFDGLVVASVMSPVSILHHTVPLLRGGATVTVYSPTIEPLLVLSDVYSPARRTAFLSLLHSGELQEEDLPTSDFPLNPSLLLTPQVYTARIRPWQVLPGRTHPLMTGRGGAEGYIFVGIRVLPKGEAVMARGKFKKRRGNPEAASGANTDKVEKSVKGEPKVEEEGVDVQMEDVEGLEVDEPA